MNLLRRMIYISTTVLIMLLTAFVYYLRSVYNFKVGTDYMTGLYNKRYHDTHLVQLIKDAQSKVQPLSLIMIDVDKFKEINDRYGHQAGDMVLKTIAQTLKSNIRRVDICSRYAGDEFVIVLPGANESNAALIAERIRESVCSLDFKVEGLSSHQVTLSIGIAEWKCQMKADRLTENADKALYLSKTTGKNKVTIYSDLILT